jgi:hypothetical protein
MPAERSEDPFHQWTFKVRCTELLGIEPGQQQPLKMVAFRMGDFQPAFADDRCDAKKKEKVLMWLFPGTGIKRPFQNPGFQPHQ